MSCDKDTKSSIKSVIYTALTVISGLATIAFGRTLIPATVTIIRDLVSPDNEYAQVVSVIIAPLSIIATILFVVIPFIVFTVCTVLTIRHLHKSKEK